MLSDACEPGRQQSDAPGAAPSALALIVDLLCFCVQQHSYRIKCADNLTLIHLLNEQMLLSLLSARHGKM